MVCYDIKWNFYRFLVASWSCNFFNKLFKKRFFSLKYRCFRGVSQLFCDVNDSRKEMFKINEEYFSCKERRNSLFDYFIVNWNNLVNEENIVIKILNKIDNKKSFIITQKLQYPTSCSSSCESSDSEDSLPDIGSLKP